MRHALVIAASLGALAALSQPAVDPVARLAALVAEGDKLVGGLLAAEAAREAYDREGRAAASGDAALEGKVRTLDADNAAYTAAAAGHATAIKSHNDLCGSAAVAGTPPPKYKTKEELAAAQAAEAKRVADCDAQVSALDAHSKALDAQLAALQARRAALQQRVDSSNASLDAQEKRGRELNQSLSDAEDSADAWLERMNEALGSDPFRVRAQGVEGCKARREMVLSGKDLKVFHDLMQTCARNLKR